MGGGERELCRYSIRQLIAKISGVVSMVTPKFLATNV